MRWSAALTRVARTRVMAPLLSTERVVLVAMRCFQPVATSAAKRNEPMPGWCSSRSRQNSRPKV